MSTLAFPMYWNKASVSHICHVPKRTWTKLPSKPKILLHKARALIATHVILEWGKVLLTSSLNFPKIPTSVPITHSPISGTAWVIDPCREAVALHRRQYKPCWFLVANGELKILLKSLGLRKWEQDIQSLG